MICTYVLRKCSTGENSYVQIITNICYQHMFYMKKSYVVHHYQQKFCIITNLSCKWLPPSSTSSPPFPFRWHIHEKTRLYVNDYQYILYIITNHLQVIITSISSKWCTSSLPTWKIMVTTITQCKVKHHHKHVFLNGLIANLNIPWRLLYPK